MPQCSGVSRVYRVPVISEASFLSLPPFPEKQPLLVPSCCGQADRLSRYRPGYKTAASAPWEPSFLQTARRLAPSRPIHSRAGGPFWTVCRSDTSEGVRNPFVSALRTLKPAARALSGPSICNISAENFPNFVTCHASFGIIKAKTAAAHLRVIQAVRRSPCRSSREGCCARTLSGEYQKAL